MLSRMDEGMRLMLRDRKDYLRLLSGSGIEIGALHRPCDVPHLRVQYVDRLTRPELERQYPELEGHAIVEADIIDDAETLATIPDGSQDFVIANHVIEHTSNPIGAMLTWCRVLRKGGRLFLAVPDKRATFDKDRQLTSIDHVLEDYRSPSEERDFAHFEDFALNVSCRFFKVRPEAESRSFAKELWDKKYSIHYHVWDFDAFTEFLRVLYEKFPAWGMKAIDQMPTKTDEFIFVLQHAPDLEHRVEENATLRDVAGRCR